MIVTDDAIGPRLQSHRASLILACPPEDAFALLCSVEKWPVWLSLLRSVRRVDSKSKLNIGSEVVVRSCLPGEAEELYEIDGLITNHRLSLVGAYSLRRRFEFRIECRTTCCKLHLRLDYPAYHGRLGTFLERWQRGRRIANALEESLVHFKGLVEYKRDGAALADF